MTDTIFTDLGTGPAGFFSFQTLAINDQGEVVGTSINPTPIIGGSGGTSGTSVSMTTARLTNTGNIVSSQAGDTPVSDIQLSGGWIDKNGVVTQLTAAGQLDTAARTINNEGQVAGAVGANSGFYGYPTGDTEAAIWLNGKVTLLGKLPGDQSSQATMLNDNGQVVGQSSSGIFLWQNGAMINIASGNQAQAYGINDQGQVVGRDNNNQPFLWQNGTLTELTTSSGAHISGAAQAINNLGVIVGTASGIGAGLATWVDGVYGVLPGSSGGTGQAAINDSNIIVATDNLYTATVWKNGVPYDLQSFAPSGWTLTSVTAINNQNEVTGEASFEGATHIYELTLPSMFPTMAISAQIATTAYATGLMTSAVAVTDSVQSVTNYLSALQTMLTHGLLSGITLTDTGEATLNLGAETESVMGAINAITSSVTVLLNIETASSGPSDILSGSLTHPTIATLPGYSNYDYSFTPSGDGVSFTAQLGDTVYRLSHITELKLGSITDIVASQTPAHLGSVTAAQVTELFAAALDREPDPDGLTYYETVAAANGGVALSTVAQWFLQSPEYSAAHSYAQSASGDQQFIGDLYSNLLHRTASASDVGFYYSNVIEPMLAGLEASTAAYAAAELKAHAQVLAYVSQSPEFFADVQATSIATSDARHWLILI